jgi:hypothetical protein
MPFTIFNPPEPWANRDRSGPVDFAGGQIGPTGSAQYVPRYYRLDIAPAAPFTEYAGTWILERRIPDPPHVDARAVWLSPEVDVTPSAPNYVTRASLYRLAFDAWPSPFAGSPTPPPWAGRWSLAAGQFAWPLAPLPGEQLTAYPGNDDAAGEAVYIPSADPTEFFRTLDPSTLYLAAQPGQSIPPAGWPPTITIRPFWP